MTTRITAWYPDTCDCKLVFQYESDVGMDEDSIVLRTHPAYGDTVICSKHKGKTIANIWQAAYLSDNKRKNRAHAEAAALFPALLTQVDPDSGATVYKKGVGMSWNFTGTGDRTLKVSFTGITLTALQKTQLQAVFDTKIGAGEVVLQ